MACCQAPLRRMWHTTLRWRAQHTSGCELCAWQSSGSDAVVEQLVCGPTAGAAAAGVGLGSWVAVWAVFRAAGERADYWAGGWVSTGREGREASHECFVC